MIQTACDATMNQDAFKGALGKEIAAVELYDDETLHFRFVDGAELLVADKAQLCCESRYMQTDDDLSLFVGAVFTGMEIKEAPDEVNEDYGVHEVQFLEVHTNKGSFTMSSHNEHNGYYSGFCIKCHYEANDS